MAAIDWPAILQAARAWALVASGYPEARVIWLHQNGDRPALPYLGLQLTGVSAAGLDALRQTFDPDAPAGEEVVLEVFGPREFTVEVRAFGGPLVDVAGAETGRAVLARLQTALSRPSVSAAMLVAGLTVVDRGVVQWAPPVRDADFEGLAMLEVRCRAFDAAEDRTGYVARVEMTDEDTGHVEVIE